MSSVVEWFIGFGICIFVVVCVHLGVEWALDEMWIAAGNAAASTRPPSNAAVDWVVSGGAGILALWVANHVMGKDAP